MMNVSDLLTSIKMDLGIYGLSLPFEKPDDTLFNVIKLKTLTTYSVFFPYTLKMNLDIRTLTCLNSNYSESSYVIPDLFGDKKIIMIKNVNPKNKSFSNGYTSPIFDGEISTYESLMMGQASADLMSLAAPPMTFKFQEPNILVLYNYATMYGEIDVEVGLAHAPNLATIPSTQWESFYELALIDVKRFLYNTLKHYNEIQTAYGTIQLKIDDWSNSESDRKEMIEKYRDVSHLEQSPIFII